MTTLSACSRASLQGLSLSAVSFQRQEPLCKRNKLEKQMQERGPQRLLFVWVQGLRFRSRAQDLRGTRTQARSTQRCANMGRFETSVGGRGASDCLALESRMPKRARKRPFEQKHKKTHRNTHIKHNIGLNPGASETQNEHELNTKQTQNEPKN